MLQVLARGGCSGQKEDAVGARPGKEAFFFEKKNQKTFAY
jgi:hypothetical protein